MRNSEWNQSSIWQPILNEETIKMKSSSAIHGQYILPKIDEVAYEMRMQAKLNGECPKNKTTNTGQKEPE